MLNKVFIFRTDNMAQLPDSQFGLRHHENNEYKYEYEIQTGKQLTIELPFIYDDFGRYTLKIIIFNDGETKNMGVFIDEVLIDLEFLELEKSEFNFNREILVNILFQTLKTSGEKLKIKLKSSVFSLFDLEKSNGDKLSYDEIKSVLKIAILKLSRDKFFCITQINNILNIKLNQNMIEDKIRKEQENDGKIKLVPKNSVSRISPQELQFYRQIHHIAENDLGSITMLRNLLRMILPDCQESDLYTLWTKFSYNKNAKQITFDLKELNLDRRAILSLQEVRLISSAS